MAQKIEYAEVRRSYEESTQDDFLYVPELKGVRYCFGYASYFRGNNHYSVESRLTKTHNSCPKFIKGCRGRWYGLAYETRKVQRQGPWALYKCRHGIGRVGLVEEISER